MTQAEKTEIKQKIDAAIKGFLGTTFPNGVTSNQVMDILPDIYRHLESQGLLDKLKDLGFNYGIFHKIAIEEKMRADLINSFGHGFR